MMVQLLYLLNVVAAAVILVVGLFSAVNNMGRTTQHGMRGAWLALTTGALAALLGNSAWSEVLLNSGIAIYIIADRRRHMKVST